MSQEKQITRARDAARVHGRPRTPSEPVRRIREASLVLNRRREGGRERYAHLGRVYD